MSSEEWFYVARGSQQGPVSLEELKQKKQDGSLADSDLVWKEGFGEWLESKDVPELSGGDASPAAAAPAPAAPDKSAAFGAPNASSGSAAPAPAETPTEPAPVATPAASSSVTPAAASPTVAAGAGAAAPTPGQATASLVCGILGIACFGFLAAIPAVVLGHMSLKKIDGSNGALGGRGFAKAGMIMGYIGIVLSIIGIIYYVFAVKAALADMQLE